MSIFTLYLFKLTKYSIKKTNIFKFKRRITLYNKCVNENQYQKSIINNLKSIAKILIEYYNEKSF